MLYRHAMLSNPISALTTAWDHEVAAVAGDVSIQLRTLDDAVASRHAESPHYAASTMKMAVAAATLREALAGRCDLDRHIEIHSTFASAVGGTFTLRQVDDQDDATWHCLGGKLPAGTLLERMIIDSSNIATNLLIEEIGFGPVRRIAATVDGLTVNRYIGDERAQASGVTNSVTAQALARFLASLANGKLLSEEPTQTALNLLARQKYRRMIPAGLPDGTWSAGKAGWNGAVNHDVALVRPTHAPAYVLAVCTTTGLDDVAERLVARLSTITMDHWTRWHAW